MKSIRHQPKLTEKLTFKMLHWNLIIKLYNLKMVKMVNILELCYLYILANLLLFLHLLKPCIK